MDELVQRQLEIIRRLANGETQKDIAEEIGVSQQAMNNFVVVLMALSGVKGRIQFARMYWEWEQRRRNAAA
jgi:DNA-binding NarL/FixJ family response regulator